MLLPLDTAPWILLSPGIDGESGASSGASSSCASTCDGSLFGAPSSGAPSSGASSSGASSSVQYNKDKAYLAFFLLLLSWGVVVK